MRSTDEMKKRDQATTAVSESSPRDGATLLDERRVTHPAARQVLEILQRGNYSVPSGIEVSIRNEQAESELGTRLYTPAALDALRERGDGSSDEAPRLQVVDVIDATTQVAAHRFAHEGSVVLLNFASARNPGGGFLGGAKAQEEDLCRCGGLYRTLLTQPVYYNVHRNDCSLLYSDHLIYSPAVPFFRTAANAPLLEAPFFASVITAAAPNAGAIRQNQTDAVADLPATFLRRWTNILAVARDRGYQTLILGAWGCGAFRNDPQLVARTAHEALQFSRFRQAFSRVIFPIPGSDKHSRVNLEAFRSLLD